MWSERKHGLSTEQVPVSAYVVSSKNLEDLDSYERGNPVGGEHVDERRPARATEQSPVPAQGYLAHEKPPTPLGPSHMALGIGLP